MSRWNVLWLLVAVGCGSEPAGPAAQGANANRSDEPAPSSEAPTAPVAADDTPSWLREMLRYDLRAEASDLNTMALGQRLGAPVACPQPGTGCFVELPLAGVTAQVHLGEDQVIQIWGPTEPTEMEPWARAVEAEIDGSSLRAVNAPGTRPDRLWRDRTHVLLLHDHSGLPCGGFCPSMMWIARPDHPSAAGYGF